MALNKSNNILFGSDDQDSSDFPSYSVDLEVHGSFGAPGAKADDSI